MQFEFDPEKSASNRAKHGFDFADAAALLADVDAISLPASSQTETRRALVARHGGAVLYPARLDVRIVSVRRARARANERSLYEQ